MFFTYVHMKPDLTPFYVGKGTWKRAHTCSVAGRNEWHTRIVRKYGRKNIVIETIECASEAEAFFRERMVIASLRNAGYELCNMTEGGEGASGAVRSQETREKHRLASTGRRHSNETKKKLAEISRGKTLSPEARAKVSAASKGRIKSPETLEKMRVAMTGRRLTDEVKAKLSAAATGRKASSETKQKMSASRTGRKQKPMTDATRKKISDALTGRKLSTETLEKLRATYTPERREQISQSLTGKKQSAEVVEKRIAPLRGKSLSESHKTKIGDANRLTGVERGAKISAALKGKKFSDEHR